MNIINYIHMKKQYSIFAFLFLMLGLAVVGVRTPVQAASPRTTTIWAATGEGGVDVVPYVRVDKKALFVDFENFNNTIDHVYYNLNYNRRDNGIKGGVEGSFFPSVAAYSGSYNGKNYIRRELIFGTCSQGVCVYHPAKDVVLTVKTYIKNGKVAQYTKVLSFPQDQF